MCSKCNRPMDDHCLAHALATVHVDSAKRCPLETEATACEHIAPLSVPTRQAPTPPEETPPHVPGDEEC